MAALRSTLIARVISALEVTRRSYGRRSKLSGATERGSASTREWRGLFGELSLSFASRLLSVPGFQPQVSRYL